MIQVKTSEEIEIMRKAGERLKRVLKKIVPLIKPGVLPEQIDKTAEKEILKLGGKPSFQTVKGYKWSICLPVNEQIVHTPPTGRRLREGDVVTLDIGFMYKGYHVDYAKTFFLGKENAKIKKFLQTGERALQRAIKKIREGRRLGEVSLQIQTTIESAGYSVVKELTGHGIGKKLHEDPYVFNFLDRPVEKTLKLKRGMTLAVEVIYAMGRGEIEYEGDGWSIITKDKSLSACFEHTIVVSKERAEILV